MTHVRIEAARPEKPLPVTSKDGPSMMKLLDEDKLPVPGSIRPLIDRSDDTGRLEPMPTLVIGGVDGYARNNNDLGDDQTLVNHAYDVLDDTPFIGHSVADRRKHGFMPSKLYAANEDTLIRAEMQMNQHTEMTHQCPVTDGGQYRVTLEDVAVWDGNGNPPWRRRMDGFMKMDSRHPEVLELLTVYNDKR